MEEKELLEIEAREIEQAKKNINEMIQRKKIRDIHLLYKDRFDLGNSRVCASFSDAPLQTLIPLHDRILVGIPPFPSSEVFNKAMGFSVDQLSEWRKRGWIVTLLNELPSKYSGLSYLDELIRVSPCRSIRLSAYAVALAGGADRFESVLNEGEVVFRGCVGPSEYAELFGERAVGLYPSNLASFYASLYVLGLTPIVKRINDLVKTEMKKAEYLCLMSKSFLVSPIFDSLKKTAVYNSELKSLASKFYEIAKPGGEVFFVPCWVGDLYQSLGLIVPLSMDTDEIEAVRKNSDGFIRAVRSLDEEIDKTVRDKFGGQKLERSEEETITAKKEEFRKRWDKDVVPAFEDIRQTEQVWSIAFTSSIVASALTLSAFTGVLNIPSALAELGASQWIKKVTDPAAEYFVRFWERNPIHLGFYKVQKEVRKLKHRNR